MLSPVLKECAEVNATGPAPPQAGRELGSCVVALCYVQAQHQLRACWRAINTPPCGCCWFMLSHCCCAQVPPQNTNRMVDAARGVLNQLLADVYIFTDAMSGAAAGASPGYGLTLVAETTTGCLISAEAAATQVCWRGVSAWQQLCAGDGRTSAGTLLSQHSFHRQGKPLSVVVLPWASCMCACFKACGVADGSWHVAV